jgi:hypothetical protein
MDELETRRRIIEAERNALRALCQDTCDGSVRAQGMRILTSYPFVDAVHQLLFDTLREIPSADPEVIRAQLPTRLNNRGFPDLDMETFFEAHGLSTAEAIALMRNLCDRSSAAARSTDARAF